MKTKNKLILTSLAMIAVAGGIAGGATYALFTSQDSANVAINSGKVNVSAALTLDSAKSLGATKSGETVDEHLVFTGSDAQFSGDYTWHDATLVEGKNVFENGGTASIENGEVSLDKLTPGDKVELTLNISNLGNVDTKYRVVFSVEDNGLASSLSVSFGDDDTFGNWSILPATGATRTIVVEMPITEKNTTDNASAKYTFSVEAVQANAHTVDDVYVTPLTAQRYLDGEFGSIDGKTLYLTPGTYEKLDLARATGYEGSNTKYFIGSFASENEHSYDEFLQIKRAPGYSSTPYYLRTLSDVKFVGLGNTTIKGTALGTGHMYQNVYDYALVNLDGTPRLVTSTNNSYQKSVSYKNISFENIKFTSTSDVQLSCTASGSDELDGLTYKNCSFELGTTASGNPGMHIYSNSTASVLSNLVVDNCTFKNCYQGVYTQGVTNVSVTNCSFDTMGHNAIAVQDNSGNAPHGDVVISNNTFSNIFDRIVRFNNFTGTSITITNNVATNAGDDSNPSQAIKATSIASNVVCECHDNNWGGAVVYNEQLQDR